MDLFKIIKVNKQESRNIAINKEIKTIITGFKYNFDIYMTNQIMKVINQ